MRAATVYWDINGTTSGASNTQSAAGTWDGTNTFFNSDSTGGSGGTIATWVPGDILALSAGGTATGSYTITVSGTQQIGGLVFEEGQVTLAGGTLEMTTDSNINVGALLLATINSTIDDGASDFNLTKTGAGTLVLGGNNTYTGKTLINAGVLSISADANLGTAPGAVAADSITFSGNSTLQITGTSNPVINSNRGITINGGVTGSLQVVDSSNVVAYGGLITGAAGTTFRKFGAGTLDLQGDSTASFLGALNVDGGTLKLSGNGQLAGTSGVTIGNRGTLTLDNSGSNLGNRTAGATTSAGGTLNFIGNAAATTETLGALTLNAGALTINSTPGAGGNTLTIPTLTRSVAGGTLYLNQSGTSSIVLSTAPALVNSILRYAVVNNGTLTSFANYPTSAGTNQTVVPLALASHNQGAETTWGAANNVRPTADVTVTAARSLYTLTLDNGIDLLAPAADRTLTITGAVLQTGGTSVIGASGTLENILAWGANEAVFITLGDLTIQRGNTNILTGSGGLTKSGPGALTINTANAVTGVLRINEGTYRAVGANTGTAPVASTAAGNGSIELNGGTLELRGDVQNNFGRAVTVNADSTVLSGRNAVGTGPNHQMSNLTMASGRSLSLQAGANLSANVGFGLMFTGTGTLQGPVTFDVGINGTAIGTLNVGTLSGAFPITKTGGGALLATSAYLAAVDVQGGWAGWGNTSGTVTETQVFTGAGGIIRNGTGGITNITSTNTFNGSVLVTAGTLQYSTVNNVGGLATNLGQGDTIELAGGTLAFVGGTSQSTNRAITNSAAAATGTNSIDNQGTGGATLTLTGAISSGGNTLSLGATDAANVGHITGGITQTGTAVDLFNNAGTWNFTTGTLVIADDFFTTGTTAVTNLNTTGILTYTAGASNGLYARAGGTININADDVTGAAAAGGNDFVILNDNVAGNSTLNLNTFVMTTPRLDVGQTTSTFVASVIGGGILTATTNINLYNGNVSARLAGAGAIVKSSPHTMTLTGDNSGLTGATAVVINAGNLLLDYTTSNTDKLVATTGFDMRGATLSLNGNGSAATTQALGNLTLASGGANRITLTSNGFATTLNFGTITRGTLANDGTIRFVLPALGGITTTATNTNGILGGYATVTTGTGTYFAANDGSNNIIGVATLQDDVSLWASGQNVSDDTGLTGILPDGLSILSLRFNAAAGSTLTIGSGNGLNISGGGILMTSNVTGGAAGISGGVLTSGTGELIFTQDGPQSLIVSSIITGAHGVTKTGVGTLALGGTNNYSGITDLQEGVLQVAGGNAIGDSSAVTLADDHASTFQLTANETIGTLAGGAALSTNSAGTTTGFEFGVVDLGANTLIIRGGTTYAGLFTGNGTLVRNSTLNGSNFNITGKSTGFTGAIVVDGGLFQMSSAGAVSATSITVNKGGNFLIDNNGNDTYSEARIPDTTPITLNSADGTFSGATVVRGLAIRTDDNTTAAETVGDLVFNSGASYLNGETTDAAGVADLATLNFIRNNNATVDARGRNMGASSGQRARFRISNATNQTNFLASTNLVGTSTTAATQNLKIIPWGIGETLTATIVDTNMGNSLVTYVSGQGLRALDFATEYDTLAAAAADDNARASLSGSNLTGVAGKTVNALVVHNAETSAAARSVVGTGAGQTLAITSGAILFTRDTAGAGTYNLSLGGFDAGITVGGTNEYVVHVVNPDSASTSKILVATISSPLNTVAASLTKSGRGTLVLSEVNTYSAGTWINEGILQAGDLDNLGAGGITFAGGTFQFGSAWNVGTDDLSTRTVAFLSGGATLDTNGKSPTFANGIGNGGAGGLTKSGTGVLTLNGAATYTGSTSIVAGSIVLGANQAIGTGGLTTAAGTFVNLSTFNASVASLTTADSATLPVQGTGILTVAGDAVLNRGNFTATFDGTMNLLKLTAAQTVTLNVANTFTGYTHIQQGIVSVNSLADAGSNSSLGAPTGDLANIRVGNSTDTGTLLYTGLGGSSNRGFWLMGTTGGATLDNDGLGALTLSGEVRGIGVNSANSKSLTLQGTAGTVGAPNVLSGNIYEGPSIINVVKAEAGVWRLGGSNVYSGTTSINVGTLLAGSNTAFGSGTLILNGGNLEDDGTARALANALTISNAASIIGGATGLTFNGALTSTVGIKKNGVGTVTLAGTTGSYTGDSAVMDGRLVLAGAVNNRLGTASNLVLGNASTSGILQLGSASGASNQEFASLSTSGTGTTNAVVNGNAAFSTLTITQSGPATFAGNIGGTSGNENNLHVVKAGAGQLIVSGTGAGAWVGTTAVSGGKLLIDSTTAFAASSAGLTVADGAEFSLRGTGLTNVVSYGFSGTGNKVTLGTGTGTATLGFRLDGIYNTQLVIAAGQTMSVAAGTDFQTAVYVDDAPTAGQQYVLIAGADPNSLHAGGGTFNANPVVFNGGSFTYALSNVTLGGTVDRWVITPTAQPAAADVWWKGDLDGLGTGVWSASTTSGTGFPTNWDDSQSGNVDALVPPDSGSIVHFSAASAANFSTTLGANLTIQELVFHSGPTDISVGGANTLTIGNTVDAAGITLVAGAPTNVGFSANVMLAQAQSFNIADSGDILSFTGVLGGVGPLGINDNGSSTGTVVLGGTNGIAAYSGATNLVTGRLILQGGATNRLPTSTALTMGNATVAAILQLGDAVNGASNTSIGSLNTGAATANSIVGGGTVASILTINQSTAGTFNGIVGGAGTNENQVGITKLGAANLLLNGANTYTGATTINAGTVRLGASGSINGTASLTLSAVAGATAVFDVNGRTAVLAGAITLGGADTAAQALISDTATGGLLTLGGNVTFDGTNNPLGSVISVNMANGSAARTFIANDSTAAAVDLALNGTYASANSGTLDGTGVGTLNGQWTLTGTNLALTKNGVGTWSINAVTNTTGTGDWNINAGVINATVSNALNAADNIIIDGTGVQDSAIVNISGTAGTSGVHQGNDFYIRNGGRANVSVNNGISTGTDVILVGDSASVGAAAAGRLDLSADISSGGGLQVGGSGGNLGNITGAGLITSAGGFSLRGGTIASGITLAGTGAITKVGNGDLTFSGARTTSGNTSIQEGNLILDYSSNNASKVGGVLTLGAAQGNLTSLITLTLNANASGTSQSVTSTTISSTGDVLVDLNDAGASTVLALGAITRSVAGGTVAFDYSTLSKATTTSAATSTLGWATVTSGGTTRIAAITGSGTNDIVQATTTAQNDPSLWSTGQNVINTAGYSGIVDPDCNTIASLTFDAAAASTITIGTGNILIITSGGILVNAGVGANTSTFTGGSILGSAAAPLGELIVHQNNTAGSLVINSGIINSSGITKSGLGTLVLGGTNSFTASSLLTVNEGTVQVNGGNAIGDATVVVMRSGSTLDLNNSAETIGNLGVDTTNFSAGTIDLGSGTLTINQSASSTFAGGFTGAGNVVKNGAGTLTLSSSSSTSGTLTINGGSVTVNGAGGFVASMTLFTLNGASFLDDQDDTTERDRVGNGADFVLNNTAGTNGLFQRTNQGNTKTENIGDIRIGAGHNVVTSHGNATNAISVLQADTLTRLNTSSQNHGTVLVRGNSLGASSGTRGTIAFDSGAQATVNGFEVGGGGAAGTTTISVIPWLVGDLSNTGLGNSFVTNVDATVGLRPLAATEYVTDATGFNALSGAATDNVRFATNPGAALTGTPTSVNSLVFDATTSITATGTAGLTVTSGAILAANTGNHILDGFTAVTSGGGRDYVVYVTTAASTFTVGSPLTSAVPLVKAGAGTLSLTNTGNLFSDVYLNQGLLLIDDLDKVNGTTNTFHFFGGGVRLAAGFVDDVSTKPWDVNTGGGSLDVSLVTAGATLANGIDDTTVSSGDTLNIFTRSVATGTTGLLTIQGAGTYTGVTVFRNSGVALNGTTTNSVVLNGTTNAALSGNVEIGDQTNVNNNFDVVVALGASDQIVDTASITFRGASGENAYFKLLGFNETVAGISDTTANGVIEVTENDDVGVSTDSTLTIGSAADFSYNGFLRNRGTGTNAQVLNLTKQGLGTQTLSGANITYTGTTTISGGALQLTDATGFASAVVNNSVLIVNRTTATQTINTAISGAGVLVKLGAGTLVLGGANGYSGLTRIDQGVLSISASNHLGDGSVTNTIRIANGATLQSTGASVDLGANRLIALAGAAAIIDVTSTNILTVSGVISGDDCTPLTKSGTGTLVFTNTNTYAALTTISGGTLQVGAGAGGGSTGTLGSGDLVNQGTLVLNRSNTLTVANNVSGTGGNLTMNGAGTAILTGTNNYTGLTTVNAGVLQFQKQLSLYNNTPASWTAANLTVNSGAVAAFNVGGAGEFTSANLDVLKLIGTGSTGFTAGSALGLDTSNASGGTFTYSTSIGDTNSGANALGLVKLGTNVLVLDGSNTYSGATTISGGTLSVGTLANGGIASGIGQATSATSNLVFSGGTLQYTGATVSTNRGFTVTAGNTGVIDVANAATRLTITGDSAATTGNLQKAGSGSLTLNGTYAHTGTTTVSAGTLNGTGTLSSQLIVQSGATYSAGADSDGANNDGVGKMAIASADWQSGAKFVFDFGQTSTGGAGDNGTNWDLIQITGAGGLTLGAAAGIYTLNITSWDLTAGAPGANTGANNFDKDAPATITPDEPSPWPASYRWLWVDNTGGGAINVADGVLDQFNVVDSPGVFTPGPYGAPNALGGHFWVSSFNSRLYVNYSSVPEPGSLLLVGLAGLGFAAYRRKRRSLQAENVQAGDDVSAQVSKSLPA